jgi:DNA-binding response OmpR family regulator
VVEDDDIYREAVVEILNLQQFDAHGAVSGEEALSRILEKGEKYELILMDVVLPGINGLETMLKLREGKFRGHIIALSGQPRYEARALAQGVDRFKVKPFSTKDLLTTITSVLGRQFETGVFKNFPQG